MPTRRTENHTTLLIAGWADTTRTAELLQPIDCQRCCWLIFIVVAIFVGLFTLLRLLANDDGLTRWPLRFLRFLFDVRGGCWEQAGCDRCGREKTRRRRSVSRTWDRSAGSLTVHGIGIAAARLVHHLGASEDVGGHRFRQMAEAGAAIARTLSISVLMAAFKSSSPSSFRRTSFGVRLQGARSEPSAVQNGQASYSLIAAPLRISRR